MWGFPFLEFGWGGIFGGGAPDALKVVESQFHQTAEERFDEEEEQSALEQFLQEVFEAVLEEVLEELSKNLVEELKNMVIDLLSDENQSKYLVAIDRISNQPHFFTYKTLAKNIKVKEKDQVANLIINNA